MKIFNRLLLFMLFTVQVSILAMEKEQTSLHQAVLSNNLELVKLLIDSGIDVQEKDAKSKTAFDYAVKDKALKKIAAYLYPFYFDLESLEKTLGYKFKNVGRLAKAFTLETVCPKRNYQKYEWLGDSILHRVLSEMLYEKNGDSLDAGSLSKARSILEQKETLAELAEYLDFEKYFIKTEKDLITIDRLEDSVESIIAALYKDGGAIAAQNFIVRYWMPMINKSKKMPESPITILESWKMTNKKNLEQSSKGLEQGIEYKIVCDHCTATEHCWGNKPTTNERIAKFYANKNFILNFPDEYKDYKDMLLISPFSSEYEMLDEDVDFNIDTIRWESEEIIFPFSYTLHMISQKLGYDNLTFNTEQYGEDHKPTFISTVIFGGLEKPVTGTEAKTKIKAKEHAAELAYTTWKTNTMGMLGIDNDINIKKLIFLLRWKGRMDAGTKSAKVLLKELLQELGYEKASFECHVVGGIVKKPYRAEFFCMITCPGILTTPLKSAIYLNVKQAEESAASMVLQKYLNKIKKG